MKISDLEGRIFLVLHTERIRIGNQVSGEVTMSPSKALMMSKKIIEVIKKASSQYGGPPLVLYSLQLEGDELV